MSETAESLREEIAPLYREVKVLDDDSVAAIGKLLFTTAIYLGCTSWGYERRYCFESDEKAREEFSKLKSEEDVPEGFVARR